MISPQLFFILVLFLTWPIRWLPYPIIHRLGAFLGSCVYHCSSKYRKRSLSNLALATSLHLSEKQIRQLAKTSLQNLMITCLEYAKFASEKEIHKVARCINPETADQLMQANKPVIFFCGHLSNWEVLFLEGTKRMPGVAIGRPIKNTHLYRWILSIRQKYGGQMITPRNAIKEGLKGLKKGSFLGIVGDQGMPDSGYSSPFFGRCAWTSPIAAILSHRTGSPIIVATTRRQEGRYSIHYSDPIWPDINAPMEQEIDRLMRETLLKLEEKIREEPGQWLWSHNRWKQQTPERLKRPFRQESILIILPKEQQTLNSLLPHLAIFREIYPHEFITIYAPEGSLQLVCLPDAEILPYSDENDLLRRDFRFKLVFNFSSSTKVKPHFKKLSALRVVSLQELYSETHLDPSTPFPEVLKKSLLRTYAI